MKTYKELREILERVPLTKMNSHVHTHVCDGAEDMTVENIARAAETVGLELIIFVPLFHKRVEDASKSLYEDSREEIFWQLREEIDCYGKHGGRVTFLLSTEADILSVEGEISLHPSEKTERCLDLITPTLNYHPLLPLEAVAVTGIRTVDEFHADGRFAKLESAAGGKTRVLETAYEAMASALEQCEYPSMLGHFFCSHTIPNQTHTWFGITEADCKTVYEGTRLILDVCQKRSSMLDLSGIHFTECTAEQQRRKDGFLYNFQCWVMEECRRRGIPFGVGSDAHRLLKISYVSEYKELYGWR